MSMKTNGDMPAAPLLLDTKPTLSGGSVADDYFEGLTKRETFCLHMGVAETGDAELDEIIRKGNRQKMTAMAMQGLCGHSGDYHTFANMASDAVTAADALLAELERKNE